MTDAYTTGDSDLRDSSGRPAIELQRVVRTFGDVVALDDVTVDIRRGETVGLLGHNGAGKTTTVRLLSGLLTPGAGTVRIDGMDPVTDGDVIRRTLGVMPAVAPVDGRLTGRQNLRFVADLYSVDPSRASTAIDRLLETFGLADRADERVAGYSTGMRQRLGLARVLLSDPAVLMLDEPSASLDPVAARRVRNLIAELGRTHERTIVLCTHDLVEAHELCDRVVVLEHGRIIAEGSPAELAAEIDTKLVTIRVDPRHDAAARRILADRGTDVEVSADATFDVPAAGPDDVAETIRMLVVDGVDVHAVIPNEPSLEDVYLALHGEDGR